MGTDRFGQFIVDGAAQRADGSGLGHWPQIPAMQVASVLDSFPSYVPPIALTANFTVVPCSMTELTGIGCAPRSMLYIGLRDLHHDSRITLSV
jgi:hypothetical protein